MGAAIAPERHVRFGDVEFEIRKLLPMEAKAVFLRHVRPLVAGALSADVNLTDVAGEVAEVADDDEAELSESSDLFRLILAAVTEAPTSHYEKLCEAQYRCINYRRDGEQWANLGSNLEHAFDGLDMAHLFILDFRAFAVNFLGSSAVLQSELGSMLRTFKSRTPRT